MGAVTNIGALVIPRDKMSQLCLVSTSTLLLLDSSERLSLNLDNPRILVACLW